MSASISTGESEQTISWWRERSVWTMVFLGFSAGIPILLIFGTLSLWLREAGVSRSTATFFSWAILGYSFKFVWAPLVDRLPIPILTRILGRRRSWMLSAQCAVIASIALMGSTDPQSSLTMMAIAAVCLGFASATQDIVIDAFRIESAEPRLQAMLSSTYIAGYRIGTIVAGAMALYIAESFGSTSERYSYAAWQQTYYLMAASMLIGVCTTLLVCEPNDLKSEPSSVNAEKYSAHDYLRFFATFAVSVLIFISVLVFVPKWPGSSSAGLLAFLWQSMKLALAIMAAVFVASRARSLGFVSADLVEQSYISPVRDFFDRYGKLALWILLLVGFYRISDIVMGVITNVFYQDMAYTKIEIASISKVFGVLMTISGSFIGGLVAVRVGVMRALQAAAILVVLTNLLFCWLSLVGQAHTDILISLPFLGLSDLGSVPLELTVVIAVDNLVQGLSLAAFIAWLSSLTNVSFTATQYAIFSSLMTMLPKVIGGYSGTLVDGFGYVNFFFFASIIGIPVIVLIHFLGKRLSFEHERAPS